MSGPTSRRVDPGWLDASRSGRRLPVRSVLRLQRTIGNREVQRVLVPAPPIATERRGVIARMMARWWRR